MGQQKAIRVLVAFGSNLGNRADQILTAWRRLDENPSVRTIRISRFINTRPAGGPDGQPDFLNAAGVLETTLDPFDLHQVLQSIERMGGRERHQFWGARTIDLDLILFGSEVVHTPHLIIPHPRMAWRPFVLLPASEVAPDMIHPVFDLTVQQLSDLARMNFRLALWQCNDYPFKCS